MDSPTLVEQVGALGSRDPAERERALALLSSLPIPTRLSVLAANLDDRNVAFAAVPLLAELEFAAAVKIVDRLAKVGEQHVRLRALLEIERRDPERFVDHLVSALEEGGRSGLARWSLAQLERLGAVAAEPAVPAIARLLATEEWSFARTDALRTLAAMARGSPEHPGSLAAFEAMLANVRAQPKWSVADLLASAAGPSSAPVVAALADALQAKERPLIEQAVDALAALGPAAREAAPALRELEAGADDDLRRRAAWALGKLEVPLAIHRAVDGPSVADLDRAIADGERSVEAYGARARARLERGDLDDAIEDATRGLAVDRGAWGLRLLRATAFLRKRRIDRALSDLRRVQQAMDPDHADARAVGRMFVQCHLLRARELFERIDYDRAAVELDKASKLAAEDDPSRAEIEALRAELLLKRASSASLYGDHEVSLELYQRALEAAPPDSAERAETERRFVDQTLEAARAAARKGAYVQAISHFAAALEVLPEDDPRRARAEREKIGCELASD